MADGQTSRTIPAKRLAVLTAASAGVALVILFGAVLPAEFGRDPTGLGKLTGIGALWTQPDVRVGKAESAPATRSYATPFRSDIVEIRLEAGGDPDRRDELEYKVHVRKGGSYIYSWDVPGIANPEFFYSEFHGHTLAKPEKMVVADYRKATGAHDNGVLTVPFDGIHGWYFQNQSENPVVVRLRLAGFYDLIPPGQPGNKAGFIAKPVP